MLFSRHLRRTAAVLVAVAIPFVSLEGPQPLAAGTAFPIGPAAGVNQPAQRAFSNVPTFGGCKVFPANNTFNTPISTLRVRPESGATIARTNVVGQWGLLRFTFWSADYSGMFPVAVPANQAMVPITYTHYPEESDPGPMPIPLTGIKPESNGDHHILVVQSGTCKLYELWLTSRNLATGGWNAGTGAIWDLNSNATRPAGWTSADAAGLPILPGLLRYDEVASGHINHALRIVVGATRRAYIWPATHQVGGLDPYLFPMGARLRLSASFDTSHFTGQSKVIAEALKNYGVIVADQGPNWMISGVGDPRWNDIDMNQIRAIPTSAFEYVDNGPVTIP